MKKNLFMTAAAIAALLTGCSTDEEIANIETSAKNAIGFNIVSNGAETKATIYNNGSTNFDFDVLAFNSTTGDIFMGTNHEFFGHDGVDIYYNGTNWDYKDPNDLAYWPSDRSKLSFYAISPATLGSEQDRYNYMWNIHGPIATEGNKIQCNLVNEYGGAGGAKNYDLMYATAFNYDKTINNTKVKLSFKHTLSQVIFKGKTSNASLEADIQSITIKNTKTRGTFSIPTDLLENDNHYARSPKASDWELQDFTNFLTAKLTGANVVVNSTTDAIDLSKTDEPILVIPQVLTPWSTTPKTAVSKEEGDNDKQSYLEIAMKLTQKGQYVIGTKSSYQTVYVPFHNSNDNGTKGWEPGKCYIYTLTFGGGYDDQGKPILTPITFEPSVEDWVDASGYNVQL